jgi:excinuclease ABC subunit A
LLWAFNELIEQGHSVVVIEHNLEVIKCADHTSISAPRVGDKGGEIVATGTPAQIAAVERSYTGVYLPAVFDQVGITVRAGAED